MVLSGAQDTSKTASSSPAVPLQVRSLKAGDSDSLIQVKDTPFFKVENV